MDSVFTVCVTQICWNITIEDHVSQYSESCIPTADITYNLGDNVTLYLHESDQIKHTSTITNYTVQYYYL